MRKMEIAIPEKIANAAQAVMRSGETLQILLKTTWKPSATIPILWVALTSRRMLLFSTLRGSHIFAEVALKNINSISAESGTRIRVLMKTIDAGDWNIQVAKDHQPQIPEFIATANLGRLGLE